MSPTVYSQVMGLASAETVYGHHIPGVSGLFIPSPVCHILSLLGHRHPPSLDTPTLLVPVGCQIQTR